MGLFDTKTKTESESQAQLWGWGRAMPGIRDATQLATQAVRTPLQYFPGQTYAAQTPQEARAIELMEEGAGAYPGMLGGYMEPTVDAWRGALGAPQAALGMNLQDVVNNPALSAAADAIQARVNRNLQENIMPGLTTQFMGYGGLGGTRQGVAEGLAAGRTSDVLAENLSRMYGDAWAQGLGAETSRYLGGLNAQQGAMTYMPQLVSAGLTEYTTPADLLRRSGNALRAEEQRAIDEEMARFQFAQMEPWQRSQMGLGVLMDPAVQFGIRTSEMEGTTTNKPSTWQNIGQVAKTIAAIYGGAMTGGAGFAALGGMGALGGGAAGGAGGAGAGAGAGAGGGMMFANPWTSFAGA